MKLDKTTSLFYAIQINSRLRDALVASTLSAKHYFNGTSDDYLRIIDVGTGKDTQRWLGKVVSPGPTIEELGDVHRNLLSIMRRVAPDFYLAPNALRLFVLHGVDGKLFVGDEPSTTDDEPELPVRFALRSGGRCTPGS
jgi:hypothetical protein